MTQDWHRRRGWHGDERGQTLHDYVAGISVFILTITVVIGLLPGLLAPYQAGGNAADATAVKRISDQLVSNLSTASAPNVLDNALLSDIMAKNDTQLQERYGLANYTNVNLSVVTLNASAYVRNETGMPLTGGAGWYGNDPTSTARIISMGDPSSDCKPACRLVVRVW